VSIDITKDKLISLEDAAEMFPKPGGGHVHSKTVKNWIINGFQGIKLDGAQVGSKFYTTTDALRSFSRRLNERRQAGSAEVNRPHTPPKKARKRALPSTAVVDFTVGSESSAAGADTVTGEDSTVEMPCQQPVRNSE
jgi:hypothetical protein